MSIGSLDFIAIIKLNILAKNIGHPVIKQFQWSTCSKV